MQIHPAEMHPSNIRVLAVDGHPAVREAMEFALERSPNVELLGVVESGAAAIERVRALDGAVDVILMDVDMPGMSGLIATEQINAEYPECRVVLVTSLTHDATIAQQKGAFGYLLKGAELDQVLEAIHAVHQGRLCFAVPPQGDAMLTKTEMEILELVAEGIPTPIICHLRDMTERVLAGHKRNLFAKLGAKTPEHAVAIAFRQGIIR
ncbi:MAG: response regulator transcription factor [Roseiflexaceae bacterium]